MSSDMVLDASNSSSNGNKNTAQDPNVNSTSGNMVHRGVQDDPTKVIEMQNAMLNSQSAMLQSQYQLLMMLAESKTNSATLVAHAEPRVVKRSRFDESDEDSDETPSYRSRRLSTTDSSCAGGWRRQKHRATKTCCRN